MTQFDAVVFGPGDYHTRTEHRILPPALKAGDRLLLGPLSATVVDTLGHPRLVSLEFDGGPDDMVEDVRLERWAPNAAISLAVPKGGEFLVLAGVFEEAGERFDAQSWLRLPPGGALTATAGAAGCTVWVKTGHLTRIAAPG